MLFLWLKGAPGDSNSGPTDWQFMEEWAAQLQKLSALWTKESHWKTIFLLQYVAAFSDTCKSARRRYVIVDGAILIVGNHFLRLQNCTAQAPKDRCTKDP